MHAFHLGIDVAKAKLDCALRLPDGKLRHKSLSNTPSGFAELMLFLSKHQALDVHVCMEATGIYWEAVAEFLSEQPGILVSVLNPFQIKAFAASRLTRTKTDKVDAALIALFCLERSPEPWLDPRHRNVHCVLWCYVSMLFKECVHRRAIACSWREARFKTGSPSTSSGSTHRASN